MSIVSVANQAQLVAALSKAVGGETFVLAPGNYGSVTINGRDFRAPVTIQSQSATSMAKLTALNIYDSSNISLKTLDIGRPLGKGEADFNKMMIVTDAHNISLDGIKLHGSLDNNPRNDGWGLVVTDTDGFSISNSSVTELSRGVVFQRSSHITVAENKFFNLRSDGANFTAVDTVTIKNNHFTGFHPVGQDHPDAIQFWTSGQTRGSANITITGNQVFQGDGAGPQGIFMRDERGNLPYKNVKIDNNLLYGNDLWHGISVLHGQGVSITNNTVVSRTTDKPFYWIAVERSDGVVVQKNVADAVIATKGVLHANVWDNLTLRGDAAATHKVPNLNKGAATTVADLLVAGYGYHGSEAAPPAPPAPPPPAPPPPAPPPTGQKTLYGTAASETIKGSSASETIYGVAASGNAPGRNSMDKLYGSGGNDIFALGDSRGAFYMDGGGSSAGRKDFVQIMDFNAGDRVQLSGSLSDYLFRSESRGTSIFRDANGDHRWDKGDELVGHVRNVNLATNALVFVPANGAHSEAASAPQPEAAPAPQPVPAIPVPHPVSPAPVHDVAIPAFVHHEAMPPAFQSLPHFVHFALA